LFGGDSHSTFSALLSGTPEAAIFRIFLRPLGKQNPDSVWKSGFYCLLLFFEVVPPGIEKRFV